METRRIGSLDATVVGLGCNNFGMRIDASAATGVVAGALDAGVNFFDTADSYGRGLSEEYLGRALRGGLRKEAVIATKFGSDMGDGKRGAGGDYVTRAADASLARLGTDYIDLYQLHRPDPEVPIAETLGALDELVRAGKVREIGCSNFSVEELREADAVPPGAARFVSVQNEYSLIERDAEAEMLPECARADVAFLPYFPLASGLLTGKYRIGRPWPEGTRLTDGGRFAGVLTERNLQLVERLARFAEGRGHTLLDLAFAWLLIRPEVASVIAGATSAAQVRANARAVAWKLAPAERDEVADLLA